MGPQETLIGSDEQQSHQNNGVEVQRASRTGGSQTLSNLARIAEIKGLAVKKSIGNLRFQVEELKSFNPLKPPEVEAPEQTHGDVEERLWRPSGQAHGNGGAQQWRATGQAHGGLQQSRSSGQLSNRSNGGGAANHENTMMSWRSRDMSHDEHVQYNQMTQHWETHEGGVSGRQRSMMQQPNVGRQHRMMQSPNMGQQPPMMQQPNDGRQHRMMNPSNMGQRSPMMHPSNMGQQPTMPQQSFMDRQSAMLSMQQIRDMRPPPQPQHGSYQNNDMPNGHFPNAMERHYGPAMNRMPGPMQQCGQRQSFEAMGIRQPFNQPHSLPPVENQIERGNTNECRVVAVGGGGDTGHRGFSTEIAQKAVFTFKGSIVLSPRAHYEMIVPTIEQVELLCEKILNGSNKATELAIVHRNRPCFSKIDSLCARLRHDLVRRGTVLANINSQGLAWAVKDFIFVFTRISAAWVILKGYIYNNDDGLNTVTKALTADFVQGFLDWQDQTFTFLGKIVETFIQLDKMVGKQRTEFMQQCAGDNASQPTQQQPEQSESNSCDTKSTSSESTTDHEASKAGQIPQLPKYDYTVTMVKDSVETQVKATINGSYLPSGSYNPVDFNSYTAALGNVVEPAALAKGVGFPDISVPPPGYQANGLRSDANAVATLNAPRGGGPSVVVNAPAPMVIPTAAQNAIPKAIQFVNEIATVSFDCRSVNEIYSRERITTTMAASAREIPTNTATKLSYLKFGMNSFQKILNSAQFQQFWQQCGPLEGIDVEAAKAAAAVLTEFFSATGQLPKIHPNDQLLYDITDKLIGTPNDKGGFSLQPQLQQQAIASLQSSVAMTLAEEQEILASKLKALVEGLLTMSKAELFFKKRFTMNYFPTFVTIYGDYFLDLQDIVYKCQARAYSNVSFAIHDIRKILHFGRNYLAVQPDTALKRSIEEFEMELNQFLKKPPFANYSFDLIKGEPNEMNTILCGKA